MVNRKANVAWALFAAVALTATAIVLAALALAPARATASEDDASYLVEAAGGSSGVSGLAAGDRGVTSGIGAVQGAADEAKAYIQEQGFKAPAFKDVLEWKLPGARCYSISEGVYYIACGGADFLCENGVVSEASGDAAPPSFATLAEANAAADKPEACVTRGLNEEGDKGHGYYVRDATSGDYALTSAEGAASVCQFGYAGSGSINEAIDAFHQSGFRTLVFPEGDYLVTRSIWAKFDNRAYYGLGAELRTDSTFSNANGSITEGVWLSVRGDVVWGERQPDLGNERYDAYYTTSHQEYNGLTFAKSAELTAPGWSNMVRVRNANDVSFSHCRFIDEGKNVLCVDLYGNYDGVTLDDVTCVGSGDVQIRDLCNNVGRLSGVYEGEASSKGWIHKGTAGGGRNVTVRKCSFTMGNSVEEGLPIFAGNQQGLYYADGTEYAILNNCLVENVTLENNSWTMEKPTQAAIERRGTSRIVAFTCGYEDSPVRNVVVRGNAFDVFANYCFVQFGYVDGVEFAGNTVKMWGDEPGGKWGDKWADIFERDSFSRAGPTSNVSIHDNTFELESDRESEGARTLTRLIDSKFKAGEITFADNEVSVAGKTTQLHDSAVTVAGNTFNLHDVKSLYSDVRDVRGNTYEIGELGNLYEADGADVKADAVIAGERAVIAGMPDKAHLMTFNRNPAYNGHSITFSGCHYEIAADNLYQWRRIAYDTSGIKDGTTLYLRGCSIWGFDEAPYNTIDKNDSEKVKLVISDSEEDVPVEYSIRYDLAGGKLAKGKSNRTSYTGLDSFTLVNPTRVGYAFAGWTGTGLSKATTKVVVASGSMGDRVYKATWKALPDYLGKLQVVLSVNKKGKATLKKLASKAPANASLTINMAVDNPAHKTRPVIAIGASAFANSNANSLKKVVVGANVQSIGKQAFKGRTKLTSFTIGKNVKTVGAGAFYGAKNLKTLAVSSPKLTKASCQKMLSGSKVTTVKLVNMTKAQKAKALKNYRAWFPKKVAGKKLVVK